MVSAKRETQIQALGLRRCQDSFYLAGLRESSVKGAACEKMALRSWSNRHTSLFRSERSPSYTSRSQERSVCRPACCPCMAPAPAEHSAGKQVLLRRLPLCMAHGRVNWGPSCPSSVCSFVLHKPLISVNILFIHVCAVCMKVYIKHISTI